MDAYEKKYKEALEWARKVMQGEVGFVLDEVLEKFPELKESEDERIRKKIIATIHLYYGEPLEDEAKEMIDWLEKQGKYNTGISEATKQKLEDNLNKALEKETPESWNKFIEKQGEQNPAWTEEDMKMIEILIGIFEVNYPNSLYKVNPAGTPTMQGIYSSEIIKWLKSLKDRVQPQPKQEWSEEDKEVINLLLELIYEQDKISPRIPSNEKRKMMLSWLKSLKPQNTWKPSDEQMKALSEALSLANNCGEESAFDLRTLYEQLKKLKEECYE